MRNLRFLKILLKILTENLAENKESIPLKRSLRSKSLLKILLKIFTENCALIVLFPSFSRQPICEIHAPAHPKFLRNLGNLRFFNQYKSVKSVVY